MCLKILCYLVVVSCWGATPVVKKLLINHPVLRNRPANQLLREDLERNTSGMTKLSKTNGYWVTIIEIINNELAELRSIELSVFV